MRKRSLSGVVLVGGRSRRMGRDKARLAWRGIPLWQRQLRLLERSGARPAWLVLRGRQRSFGRPEREIRDRQAGAGPISGLHAALGNALPGEWIAVLAVDMPHVDPSWFRQLRARCGPGTGAVWLTSRGFEPLAAIYPRAALAIVTRRMAAGHFALQDLVAELVRRRLLRVVRLPEAQCWRAANWNSPADLPRRGRSPR